MNTNPLAIPNYPADMPKDVVAAFEIFRLQGKRCVIFPKGTGVAPERADGAGYINDQGFLAYFEDPVLFRAADVIARWYNTQLDK